MTNNPPTIETERLILRPFTLHDVAASYEMNQDAEVSKYTGDGGVISIEEMERRIVEDVMGDYKKHGFGRFAVELKSTGNFIGFAGLKYLDDYEEVDIGYRFMSKFWGNGYATESGKACLQYGFEQLNLEKIIGLVLPENKGSVHVLKKLGFEFEKETFEHDQTAHVYAIYEEKI